MAGSDDKFNYPNLTLPSEFLRQLNLPPDFAQRLKALVSPEVAQKLQQLAQNNPYRLLTPQVREMIALVLEKRRDKAAIEKELHRLELWLDSEIDRKLWDRPTAAAASEKIEPSLVASAEQAKPVSTPAISELPPAPSPPPPQEPTPIALVVQTALAALSSPSPSEQPPQEPSQQLQPKEPRPPRPQTEERGPPLRLPEEPQLEPSKLQPPVGTPTAAAWVPFLLKRYPRREGESPEDYVNRVSPYAPKKWSVKTYENSWSLEKKNT
jgi:hypothetical protein